MRLVLCFVALLAVAVSASGNDKSDEASIPLFEPTDDWKEVLPGQHIPGGLEVRMDLTSGGRLARKLQTAPADERAGQRAVALLPGAGAQEFDDTAKEAGDSESVRSPDNSAALAAHAEALATLPPDARKLAEVLLSLPESETAVASILASGATGAPLARRLREVWAQRQAELQEAMAGMQTEGQLIQGLLAKLVGSGDGGGSDDNATASGGVLDADEVARRVSILRDLEFHVSSVINAEDFVAMGGLPVLFEAMEAGPSLNVAQHAAWVLGTAVKNHPPLQANATRLGAVWSLTQLLRRGVAAAEELGRETAHLAAPGPYPAALETRAAAAVVRVGEGDAALPLQALSKGVYALGALLRRCPEAQLEFERLGGGALIGDVVQASVVGTWHGRTRVRTRVSAHADELALASPAAASIAAPAAHPPTNLSPAATAAVEEATRGDRRLAHAGRTLCAKTLTLLADLHADVALAAAEAAEVAAHPESFQAGRVRVTVKGTAEPPPVAGTPVSLLGPAAAQRQRTCERVRAALAAAEAGGCRGDVAQALPPRLRALYSAAVPEGELMQGGALDRLFEDAHAVVGAACE